MALRITDLGTRQFLGLLLPFAIVLLVGILGRAYYPHDWSAHALADAFFEACAVAGLIGLVVELSAAKRLIQHVSEELAGRLVGYGLPRELQELMSKTLQTGVVLKDVVKEYRFVEADNFSFDVEMTMQYRVVNYGDHSVDYRPHLSEERNYDPKFLRLEYGPNGNEFSFDADGLVGIAKIGKTDRAIEVNGPEYVRLRAFRQSPDSPDVCRVLWRWTVRMPRDYSDIIAFGGPAIGVTMRCTSAPDYVQFAAGGPGVEQGAQGSSNWVSKEAFLASQHLRVWWRPKIN